MEEQYDDRIVSRIARNISIQQRTVSAAEALARKLNKEIEKGNDTSAFLIAMLLAAFKDFIDIILDVLLIGEIPGVNFLTGLFLTSFLFFFMFKKGYFLKTRLKIWFWVLGLFFDGLPLFSALPTNVLLVAYAWRLAKKRKAHAEVKLENLDRMTARDIEELNNNISLLEDGAVNRDAYKYNGPSQINSVTENQTDQSRTERTTQYQNSMNNVLDLQNKIPQTEEPETQ